MTDKYDDGGEIYFIAPITTASTTIEGTPWGENETHPIDIFGKPETSTVSKKVYKQILSKYRDVTTPPKTRTKCVKWAYVGPLKTCVGWKTQQKHLNNTATLIVSLKTAKEIQNEINNCLTAAAVVAALAAIYSGGSAAVKAFEDTFYTCLYATLNDDLVSVRLHIGSKWTDWY